MIKIGSASNDVLQKQKKYFCWKIPSGSVILLHIPNHTNMHTSVPKFFCPVRMALVYRKTAGMSEQQDILTCKSILSIVYKNYRQLPNLLVKRNYVTTAAPLSRRA